MSCREIDMIPASYRERLKIQQCCQLFIVALVVVIVLTIFFRLSLNRNNTIIRNTITTLERNKSFNLQQQVIYNELLNVERKVKKNLEILNGLRGGVPVRQTLEVIDRVLNENIWFLHWSFKRAGEIVNVQQESIQAGYFIIIPQENSHIGKQQTWRLDMHMEIKGQAMDHSSLSLFVQNLLKQSEINDVKIVNTQKAHYINTQVVEFNIVIVINNQQNNV